ncbi:hypothetical protein PEDI_30480 [Persicobacter diffluens]|uniref:Uncharacterized protein n=1 Tax=Persicobacter diffluens TaxID=981 RepID=A0AAN4VYP4_9BACT|nr:hypothetical protein PEDI_30480 [Persicobacter diffluens]
MVDFLFLNPLYRFEVILPFSIKLGFDNHLEIYCLSRIIYAKIRIWLLSRKNVGIVSYLEFLRTNQMNEEKVFLSKFGLFKII